MGNNKVLKVKDLLTPQTKELANLDSLPIKRRNLLGLTDYEGAKYLIDHVAHSNDSRFKPAALK